MPIRLASVLRDDESLVVEKVVRGGDVDYVDDPVKTCLRDST